MKAKVSKSIMLTYPDPAKPFDVYPDVNNDHAMGAIRLQDGKTISTFSQKFTDPELKYNITKKEFLALHEAYKYFHHITYGCEVRIHPDHMNLQLEYARHVNNCVLR